METCERSGKFRTRGILLCLWLVAALWRMPGALGMDTTLTVESADGASFPDLNDIVVGGASDVIVTVRCVATPVGPVEWSYGGNSSVVTSGLTPFGVSQEDGVLRIYPASLLGEEAQYTCNNSTHTVSVQFRLVSDLFFTTTVPPTINMGTDVTTVCPVPNIPQATVTAENPMGTNDITYCNVTSERGSFRSRSVTVVDPTQQVPTYRIEPVNITARPTSGGSARAAFSCSITPDENLTTIQWFFEPMEFGSGMGPSMMVEPGFLTSGTVGVANVTVVGGLADPGTSILVLDGVGNDQEGFYSCVATFSDGRMINSTRGALIYNATANNEDTIILSPPTTLTVQEREAVTVPCVAPGNQQPTFMFGGSDLPTGAQSNQYSLDFTAITPESNGSYSCQVGTTTSTFTINVLEPLIFTADSNLQLQPEYRVCPGDRVVLRCDMPEGNPPPGLNTWLRNGIEVVESGTRVMFANDRTRLTITTVEEGDAGIYQCLSSVDNQPATTIAQSGYFNIYSLLDIAIDSPTSQITLSLPDTPPTITLNCSVVAHPIPRLEWTMNGQPVVGQQAATDFMETSFSLLTVNTSDLVNGVETFNCTATLDLSGADRNSCINFDGSISASVNVTAYSMVNITEDPESTGPVMVGETAMFTCQARSIPSPTITWFQFQNGMEVELVDNDDITITSQSQPEDSFTTRSVLSVRVTGDEDFTEYFCVGDNQFDNSTSERAQLGSMVNITEDPQSTGPLLVGETAMFTCQARSIPLPTITWFRFQNGMEVELVDNDDITITSQSQPEDSFTTRSVLSVRITGDEDFTEYFCVGDNQFDNTTSDNATLGSMVNITQNPESTGPVMIGGTAMFTCQARSIPSPTITWFRFQNGMEVELMDNDDITITSQPQSEDNFTTRSDLSVRVTGDEDFTEYFCVGDNQFDNTTSERAQLGSMVNITEDPQSTEPLLVGETAMFTCQARSIPSPSITWFRFQNGMEVELVDNDNITIISQSQPEDNFTTRSDLSVRVTGDEDFTEYFCVGDNQFDNTTSDNATLVQAVPPSFLENPSNVTAAIGDFISLNCTATGLPLPTTIVWEDGEGGNITDDEVYNITTVVAENVVSVLEFVAFDGVNGSQFRCVAENRAGRTESELATIIIGGVPLPPNPVVDRITSRTALVSWPPPFSILPLTQYVITWVRVDNGEENSTIVDADTTQLLLTDLRPNQMYRVTVVAVNRVGASPPSDPEVFTTPEDVPEAPPANVTTSSTRRNEIDVSWDPPPLEEQNGVITHYNVCYEVEGGAQAEQCVNSSSTSITLTMDISLGTTYLIRVAPATAVGLGPFSGNLQQITLSEPPSIPPPPSPSTNVPVTTTTISITLPNIVNLQEFSHFWVITLITDASIDTFQQPTAQFSDNSTFTTYSSSVSPGIPYIVAEISSMNYPMTFVLGADNNSLNDFQNLYRNGPLQPNTEYASFVWGFSPSVPNGVQVSKRQASSLPRQYSSFSSSGYLLSTRTAAVATGLTGGAIAGIVIAIVLFVILLVGTVVLVFAVWGRRHLEKKIGPPPSRQGSMRLREQRQVVLTNLRNRKAESELQDLNPDDVRLPISVEEFPNYMKSMHANSDHLFSEEYQIVSIKSPNLPHVQCSLPYNVNKNRYANINCYDDSRVHLSLIPGVEGSDYINANYIDGYQKKNAYIATQGPLPNTTPDFWRMVWEYQSCCIIMLTNVVEKSRAKCHQYWPEAGSVSFGDLTVTILEVQELAYYTIRTFRMQKGNERFEVKQFHYTAWPDFGVPDHPNPVIAFVRRINNFKRTLDGPDIIHCSAGVGRTGTLITIQSMMQMMYEEGKVDIFNFVLATRRQRNYMVQTEHQYIFIHNAILELINVGETEIPIHNLRRRVKELQAQNPESELSPIEEEYIHLKEVDSMDNTQFESARMAVNVTKNRFQEILPYDSYRVRLLLHPGVLGSDYMNASYVDGYQQRHQYILTQGPLKHTVDDFWRMVWEHRASTIMMLCQLEEKGKEQSARYWPMDKLRQHGDLFVELTQQQDFVTYTTREFSITNTKINESRMVRHFQYIDWPEDHCPTNAAAIIDLIGVLQKAQRQLGGGPIIVHDSTSVGRAGTFCVLSSVLEQLKVEGIVDIFFTIHSLRQQQPGIVSTMDQYKFCYQAVLEFLDSFDHYANFD